MFSKFNSFCGCCCRKYTFFCLSTIHTVVRIANIALETIKALWNGFAQINNCDYFCINTWAVCWGQTVLGHREEVLPEGEHHHPGEEGDPGEEAHQGQDGDILAVGQLELCCAKQDCEHDQDLE